VIDLYCKETIGAPTPREEDNFDQDAYSGGINQELQTRLAEINTSIGLSQFVEDNECVVEPTPEVVEEEEEEDDIYDVNLYNLPLNNFCVIS
jgi:hypothetical protein